MLAIRKGNFFVELELHSIGPVGQELITYRHCHERFSHADFMTYRINRNATSSRAIPYERMKRWVTKDPAMPLHLGRNRPGMSVGTEVDRPVSVMARIGFMMQEVIDHCDVLFNKHDLHKELLNRYTEPWGWINVVSTWSKEQLFNAAAQRCSPEAGTSMQRLLISMLRLYRQSEPQVLRAGEWHIPFVKDKRDYNIPTQLVWSVARCAWVSLKTVDDREATWEEAKRRHDGCIEHIHMSPLEHQKRANPDLSTMGTTRGWDEYRHMIPGQMQTIDVDAILARYGDRDFLTKDMIG